MAMNTVKRGVADWLVTCSDCGKEWHFTGGLAALTGQAKHGAIHKGDENAPQSAPDAREAASEPNGVGSNDREDL